jgi:hypothetical protein
MHVTTFPRTDPSVHGNRGVEMSAHPPPTLRNAGDCTIFHARASLGMVPSCNRSPHVFPGERRKQRVSRYSRRCPPSIHHDGQVCTPCITDAPHIVGCKASMNTHGSEQFCAHTVKLEVLRLGSFTYFAASRRSRSPRGVAPGSPFPTTLGFHALRRSLIDSPDSSSTRAPHNARTHEHLGNTGLLRRNSAE